MKKLVMTIALGMSFCASAWCADQAKGMASPSDNPIATKSDGQQSAKKKKIYLTKINCSEVLKNGKKNKMQSFFFVDKNGDIVCLVKAKNQNPNISTANNPT